MGECASSNKYVKKVHTLCKWDDNEKVRVELLNYLSQEKFLICLSSIIQFRRRSLVRRILRN